MSPTPARAPGRQRLLVALALVVGAAEIYLAHRTTAPGGIVHRRWALLAEIAGMWACFVVVAVVLLRVRTTRTVVVVALLLGVVLRVGAVSAKAPLSDDLYRYAFDGVVQTHGVDPYRYPPDAPQLTPLRTDRYLFPAQNKTKINRPDVRTIYPPVAEAWFTVLHLVVPLSTRDRGYEVAGLVVDLAILAVLLALLYDSRRRPGVPTADPRWIVLYALCPLPVLEVVQNAHVDGFALLLMCVALLLQRRGHGRWAALALAAAILVKVYPAVLLPILLRRVPWREKAWRAAIVVVAVVVAYAPHVAAVGFDVIGYLPGYLQEEHYDAGSRYLVVGLTGLTGRHATELVAVLIAAAVLWAWRTRRDDLSAALWLFTAVLLLVTPVQPWYTLLVAALVALTGEWVPLLVSAATYVVFFGTILYPPGSPIGVHDGRVADGIAALLVVVLLLVGRRRWALRPPADQRSGAVANSATPTSKATAGR